MRHPRAGTTMARVAIPRITVVTPIEVIVPVRPITVVIADTTMARYLGTDTRRLLALQRVLWHSGSEQALVMVTMT